MYPANTTYADRIGYYDISALGYLF